MNQVSLKARQRTDTGKQVAKSLRRDGALPAVVYGSGESSTPLTLDYREFEGFLRKTRGESVVINLEIEGMEDKKALLRDIQRDYLRNQLLHADFQQIRMSDRITTEVSLVMIGEPIGVTRDGGVLDQSLRVVEISCVASEIPEHLEVDISELSMGDTIHISDLSFENVEIVTDGEVAVVSVLTPMAEEPEEEEVDLEQEEPEIIGQAREDGEEEDGTEDEQED
ncbi:MAG: 50S ribosomal protein L25 [Gemmatimonadetes bacterium]|jgi:large subunit ribosomal protein L25|nr:50S ribosomal protein L25 [Gemmatimonadota bacterium]MXX02567.1 50S ribosomal protein L25 [Gemmatimonadota bacterium]MYD24543.1 50S ribosomal protein L25 [Gemmatimonadota bacterium]MYI99937.1 50S ribosomal protein L25 [Gemmatimonadota bacterium]